METILMTIATMVAKRNKKTIEVNNIGVILRMIAIMMKITNNKAIIMLEIEILII